MSQQRSVDLAVLGGGISGLTLGFLARRRGLETVVLEAAPQPGGSIRTWRSPVESLPFDASILPPASAISQVSFIETRIFFLSLESSRLPAFSRSASSSLFSRLKRVSVPVGFGSKRLAPSVDFR